METAMMNGMCRCCASEGVFKDIKTTYTWMGAEEIYADMLKECFDINVSESDNGEDGGICEVCITQLRNASNFKKQVLNTEEQFKNYIQSKIFKSSMVKVELMDDPIESDDNNLSADETYSGAEYEVPIKKEDEEAKPKKRKAAAEATTSRTKKSKAEVGESSTKRDEENECVNVQVRPTVSEMKDIVQKNQKNLEQIILTSNATPILRQADIGYFCFFCDSHFRDPPDLKQHNLDVHTSPRFQRMLVESLEKKKWIKLDITNLTCKLCHKSVHALDNLFEHLKEDHSMIVYPDVKQLVIPFNFDSEFIRCCVCFMVFEKFKKLMEHMHVHYRNFVCAACDLGFITHEVLTKHLYVHRTGTFNCNHCPKVFDTLRKRRYHEKFTHFIGYTTMKYKCGYCVERFSESHYKDEHLAKVHGMPYNLECTACHKTFKCKKYLIKHIKREHLMERNYQCPDCDMRFFSVGELNRHSVKHSGIKGFQCDLCMKSFGRKTSLTEHMRIHNNERRFKCDHCQQTFIQKCSWKFHMKNKHGEIV